MVRIPASWVTSSGWPARLDTSSDGSSSEARIATDPEITRTLSAATAPRSRVLGELIVQRGIAVPPRAPTHLHGDAGRAVIGLRSYDISCRQLVKMYRECRASRRAAGAARRPSGTGAAGLAGSPV